MASLAFRRKHAIVLNPEGKCTEQENSYANVLYDKTEWKLPEKLRAFAQGLSKNNQLTLEDKILLIYEKICTDYVYDDNIISYIQKLDDESFDLPDWYGRDVDQEWEKNREKHNRRVCYEVSRYLAQSLMDLSDGRDNFDVCILWDKGLTHYFVGLTSNDYSITLDVDDFNNIKDLTRIKTGLTALGIVILEDKEGKFKSALDRVNENRTKDAIKKIEDDVGTSTVPLITNTEKQETSSGEEPEDVVFLRNATEVLKEKYGIDSQGMFEYMKEIVDIKLGPEARKKVWKRIRGDDAKATRYIRCLVVNVDGKSYLIDGDEMLLRSFDTEELKREDSDLIPFKELSRDGEEFYNGS